MIIQNVVGRRPHRPDLHACPRAISARASTLIAHASARELRGNGDRISHERLDREGVGRRRRHALARGRRAERMFELLAREGINIHMISTSEIKISVRGRREVRRARGARAPRRLRPALACDGAARRQLMSETPKGTRVELYDTTLRDGTQAEGIAFSVVRQAPDRRAPRRPRGRLHRGRLSGLEPAGRRVLPARARGAAPEDGAIARLRHDPPHRRQGRGRRRPAGAAGRRHRS